MQTKGHASKWSYDSEEVTLERIIAEPDLLQFAGHYYVERHNMYNHHFLLSNCDSGVAEVSSFGPRHTSLSNTQLFKTKFYVRPPSTRFP